MKMQLPVCEAGFTSVISINLGKNGKLMLLKFVMRCYTLTFQFRLHTDVGLYYYYFHQDNLDLCEIIHQKEA